MYVSRKVSFDEEKEIFEKKNWDSLKDLTSSVDRASVLRALIEGLTILADPKESPISSGEIIQSTPPDDGSEKEAASEEASNEEHNDSSDKEVLLESGEESEEEETTIDDSEESEPEMEAPVAAPPLRRSTRIRYGPENWKNNRVYYNSQAVAHPIQGVCSVASLPSNHQTFLSKIDEHKVPSMFK